jgi:transposase
MTLPDWVKKWKTKNIEIHRRGNNYYAYRIHSEYDPVKKRSRKVTDEYLGKITPDGIIPPKHKRKNKVNRVLEAGNIALIDYFSGDLKFHLKSLWPHEWQSILSGAIIKLAHKAPLKRFDFYYNTSYLKILYPDAHLSKNTLTRLLEDLGMDWDLQKDFFMRLAQSSEYMAIDLTHIFSNSSLLPFNELGYNSQDIWREQVNLLLIWGLDTHHPTFLKILPGSIHSATSLVNAIKESNLKNVILVCDKGFYSEKNLNVLEENGIHYIVSLNRGLKFLKYIPPSKYKHRFFYRKSLQWYNDYIVNNRRVITYLDKVMYGDEERIFFTHVEDGNVPENKYKVQKNRFGTLSLITDLGLPAEKIYSLYKERKDIEYAFDALKNTIESDKTWMQTSERLRGYFFITFIALYLYSRILEHLRRKDLLKEYSVDDVLIYLSKLYVIQTENSTIISEIPKKTRKLIQKLELPITQKLGS